ncbi:MAG TPA: HEAT repeat domain-containing protein [Chthoniobacteraceae bacterium]|nr:HEAT repeat domain-containing protein [Chthoniobacteraceae bacterium]
MIRFVVIFASLCLGCAATGFAAEEPARSDADILRSVKLPEGYEATVFASPPQLGYPTSVSAAIDGTIFVAVDENGSIDRVRNALGKPRGYVLRLRDTDGDGKADEFKKFAEMESPRGVIWDGPSGTAPGTLIVMHPPNLTAYTDTDGAGVADKQEDIVTGLGFDLGFRGADHTTNGCRLAIDGFVYIAVGDYGFVKAIAKDGTTLSMRGGGIVRVRPDGTGFEIVSRGQRNIYDVAISPTLDLFTRDNTNDGGGWDVRLSFVPPGAHMGYPTLFVNFPEDHLQPLADYGGGSPCGALWLDEPGLPSGLFTVEWGRNAIMRHTLKPKGAGWEVDGPKHGEEEWIKLVRPTDMDVDAAGRLYITSWEGATFSYNGPNAGYVLRVVKKDAPKVSLPDLTRTETNEVAAAEELLKLTGSKSGALRLAAQRELIRCILARPDSLQNVRIGALEDSMVEEARAGEWAAAYAAYFVFAIAGRSEVGSFGTDLAHFKESSPEKRLLEVRVLGSGDVDLALSSIQAFVTALDDSDPRVRVAAITALRRLGKADTAPSILPLVADPDPIISHLAIRALSELKASQVCLAALDSADEKVKPGALQALYGIHEPVVVDGLIAPITDANGELRRGILNALCRLDLVDAPYLDPKEWWGTRPDTSGPVYKPVKWAESDKIEAALKRELDSTRGEDARWLTQRMYLTKINFPGLVERMLAACGNDTPARLTAIEGLFRSDNSLPPEGIAALSSTAANEAEIPDLRARALRLFQRASERSAALDAAIAAFAPFAGQTIGQPALSAVFEDFTRDSKHTKNIAAFARLAESNEAQRRILAQTILVNLATSTLVKGKEKEAAESAVEKSWAKPETAASLLGVIARTKARAFAPQVEARLKDSNNAVAEAALFAHQSLGLTGTPTPTKQIGEMNLEMVAAIVNKGGGDAKAGKEMFLRAGCIACHTIDTSEPAKGPVLSAAAKIYDRAALTESILKPNAKIAQGFESQWIETAKTGHVEGFVTRESGDSLDVRNIVGQAITIEKTDIKERGKRDISMMPEGLLNAFTSADLVNLLAYLESLKAQ